jgi:hypothetical protein
MLSKSLTEINTPRKRTDTPERLIDWDMYDQLKAEGLSQTKIAPQLGISQPTLSRRLAERHRNNGAATDTIHGLYAFGITVELRQAVALGREPSIIEMATTWSSGLMLGTIGSAVLRNLRHEVADMVDTFINAYLAVNPEQASRTLPRQPRQPAVQRSTIREVQERLADRGFNPGPLDGQMGEKTQFALLQFQRAHGLPPTGGLDEATRAALGLDQVGGHVLMTTGHGVFWNMTSVSIITIRDF